MYQRSKWPQIITVGEVYITAILNNKLFCLMNIVYFNKYCQS